MVELNHRDRTIKVKIVYYGPPVGGKTTNLQILHRTADAQRRGEMISVNSAQDRTILFDLLPLKTTGFRGFDLRLQVLAVPGQAMYAATRRLVLKGADSLVFVANSALDRWEENIQSYREMTTNLLSHHLDPSSMPLVFQYNKRDLPQVMEIEALDRTLNARRAEAIPAVAVRGEGVLETFAAILARTVLDLASRYAILDVKGGAPARDWAEDAVLQLFGTRSLKLDSAGNPIPAPAPPATAGTSGAPPAPARPVSVATTASAPRPPATPAARPAGSAAAIPPPPPPPSGHTILRIAPPSVPAEDKNRAAAPPVAEARANELVESYAEASAQLGTALTELREERDGLRQQLQDLRRSMQASQQILDGTPLDAALGPVLAAMARVAGVDHAAFWVMQRNEPPRAASLLRLASDPVLGHPGALRYVQESSTRGSTPNFALAADNLDIGQALEAREGRFAAVLVVPFRTPGGLHGVAAFYYAPDTARPGVPTRSTSWPRSRAPCRLRSSSPPPCTPCAPPSARSSWPSRAARRCAGSRASCARSSSCATASARSAAAPTRRRGSSSSTSGSRRRSPRRSRTAVPCSPSAAARSDATASTSRTCWPSCARRR